MNSGERSKWRDVGLSIRHKEWGFNLPATDIDILLIEYDEAEVVALIEYKHEVARPQDFTNATYRAIASFCSMGDLPFFCCFYASDYTWFKATGVNDAALTWVPEPHVFEEKEWVAFLLKLRGRPTFEHTLKDADRRVALMTQTP